MKISKYEAERLALLEEVSKGVKELLLAKQGIMLGRICPPAPGQRTPRPATEAGTGGRRREDKLLPSLNQDLDFDDMLHEVDDMLH